MPKTQETGESADIHAQVQQQISLNSHLETSNSKMVTGDKVQV